MSPPGCCQVLGSTCPTHGKSAVAEAKRVELLDELKTTVRLGIQAVEHDKHVPEDPILPSWVEAAEAVLKRAKGA